MKPWWLEEANRRTSNIGKREIAARISKGRKQPWSVETIRDLLRGSSVTYEKAVAFSREFGMPDPVYYPRSFAEADRMRVVAAEYDPMPERVLAVDEILEETALDAERQTSGITSEDEAGSKRRGTRRVGRSGTPTS